MELQVPRAQLVLQGPLVLRARREQLWAQRAPLALRAQQGLREVQVSSVLPAPRAQPESLEQQEQRKTGHGCLDPQAPRGRRELVYRRRVRPAKQETLAQLAGLAREVHEVQRAPAPKAPPG